MLNKVLPTADQIDLIGIPDEEIGRIFVRRLLVRFNRIPERRRVAALGDKLGNRATFIESIRKEMLTKFANGGSDGDCVVNDLSGTAEVVASALLGALLKVYPEQLQ